MKTNENNASVQEKNEVTVVENPALMNTAKVIDRILKVFQGIAVACMIVAAVFIPLTLIFGEKVIADASQLETGCLRIVFTGDMSAYLDMDGVKLNIVMALVSAIIPLAAGWYCIRVLRGILAPMKEGRAFAEGISKKIKKLGWTALIGGGLVEIARIAEDFFFVRAYRLDEIISHPSVESVGAAFGPGSVHPWFIFAALVMFFLSFVFRCGEELQRQSDETL
ncbi:MAG: hypothetical protein IKP26_01360 [Clostridia bacterium]|nr:hypothetical protein [Clostridia bacterium]